MPGRDLIEKIAYARLVGHVAGHELAVGLVGGGLPGLGDLMKKAPATGGGLGGLLGGLAGAVGGNAGLIATILQGFGKLGLTADHAKKFVPVILEFLKTLKAPPTAAPTTPPAKKVELLAKKSK